jgi:hypothetical protein
MSPSVVLVCRGGRRGRMVEDEDELYNYKQPSLSGSMGLGLVGDELQYLAGHSRLINSTLHFLYHQDFCVS